jgi:hypothetical protein
VDGIGLEVTEVDESLAALVVGLAEGCYSPVRVKRDPPEPAPPTPPLPSVPKPPGVPPEDGFALVRLDLDCGYLSESRAIACFAARSDGEIFVAAHRADYPDGTPNRDCWTEHRILEVKHGELVIPVPRWK